MRVSNDTYAPPPEAAVELELGKGKAKAAAKALLDTGGGGGNYISYHFLLEKGFRLDGELPPAVGLADGRTTTCYGEPELKIHITDSEGKKNDYLIPFKVIEIAEYDVILGRTWLSVEYLENQLFVEEPGYYLGESLEPSLKLLDSKPTTWEEFIKKNVSAWK